MIKTKRASHCEPPTRFTEHSVQALHLPLLLLVVLLRLPALLVLRWLNCGENSVRGLVSPLPLREVLESVRCRIRHSFETTVPTNRDAAALLVMAKFNSDIAADFNIIPVDLSPHLTLKRPL